MNPTRPVGTTERTRYAGRMDRRMDGWIDGQMDEVKPWFTI